MSDCGNCKHYKEDRDVNYQDCEINEDDKYWFTDIDCPSFEEVEDYDERMYSQN